MAGLIQRISTIRKILPLKSSLRNYSANNSFPQNIPTSEEKIHLNKGRLDWLFADGYKRPLAEDQGGKMRKDWICYGLHPTNEYLDWKLHHALMFIVFSVFIPTSVILIWYRSDWPDLKEWSHREAFLEMERREKAGLPYISKDYVDPKVVLTHLPSEEELGDFKIII